MEVTLITKAWSFIHLLLSIIGLATINSIEPTVILQIIGATYRPPAELKKAEALYENALTRFMEFDIDSDGTLTLDELRRSKDNLTGMHYINYYVWISSWFS